METDPQELLREAQIAPDDTEIGVGGISEQNHRESQFRQEPQPLAGYVDAQHAQPIRTENKTGCVNTIGPLIKDRSILPATAL